LADAERGPAAGAVYRGSFVSLAPRDPGRPTEPVAGPSARDLRHGAAVPTAFLEILGADDFAKLPGEARAHLDRSAFDPDPTHHLRQRLEDVALEQRSLRPAEAPGRLGSLVLCFGPEHNADARAHFQAAMT
jgi:hypothetical protein